MASWWLLREVLVNKQELDEMEGKYGMAVDYKQELNVGLWFGGE